MRLGAFRGGHHHQLGQPAGNLFRRYYILFILAIVFALLPAVLFLHSGPDQCRNMMALYESGQSEFSVTASIHYNFCKVRLQLAGLIPEAPHQAKTANKGGGGGASFIEVLFRMTRPPPPSPPPSSPPPPPPPSPPPPPPPSPPSPPPPSPPPPPPPSPPPPSLPPPSPPPPLPPSPPPPSSPTLSPPPPSPPPPSPPPPSPPPVTNSSSLKQQQNQAEGPSQETQQQPATEQHKTFHEYDVSKLISIDVSKTATDVHGEALDWSDFDLPQTQADLDRLMSLPHVDECYHCTICVPNSALRLNEKRQLQQQQQEGAQQQQESQPLTQPPNHQTGQEQAQQQAQQPAGSSRRRLRMQQQHQHQHHQQQHNRPQTHLENPAEAEGLIFGLKPISLGGDRQPGSRRLHAAAKYNAMDATESGPEYHIGGRVYNISDIAPGSQYYKGKAHMPNCTVCRGCDHTLEMMASGSILQGSYYAHEPGGSPSWLFRVRTDRTPSGWAVVKVWCVPVLKPKQRGLGMCTPKRVYSQVKLLLAQQKLTAECGFNSIVPRVWVEPLNGVMPGSGFHVKWLGLWADIADGVSLQNFQEAGKPRQEPQAILDFLTNRINRHEVVQGAIFDLLFSQCDRHQQNIFLTETGKIWLIDNDQVYATAWRRCGVDSLLIPTTQKFMINHLGFGYVLKNPPTRPPHQPEKHFSPLLLMDYRCHVPGGSIGNNFTSELYECMSHISSMTAEAIHEQYGYPSVRMADAVRNRSRDLLTHGYEWTLLQGEPTNQPMHRYKVAPKCCAMHYNPTTRHYDCDTPGFKRVKDLPYGNAWHGGPWQGLPGGDTGSYEGGTSFEPEWLE